MADSASVNFGYARKELQKAAKADPEFFAFANDVLYSTHDGKILLMHALLSGLKAAYEAGRAGRALPPLKYTKAPPAPVEETEEPAPAVKRVTRKPAAPTPPPAAPKRVVRGAR